MTLLEAGLTARATAQLNRGAQIAWQEGKFALSTEIQSDRKKMHELAIKYDLLFDIDDPAR